MTQDRALSIVLIVVLIFAGFAAYRWIADADARMIQRCEQEIAYRIARDQQAAGVTQPWEADAAQVTPDGPGLLVRVPVTAYPQGDETYMLQYICTVPGGQIIRMGDWIE